MEIWRDLVVFLVLWIKRRLFTLRRRCFLLNRMIWGIGGLVVVL